MDDRFIHVDPKLYDIAEALSTIASRGHPGWRVQQAYVLAVFECSGRNVSNTAKILGVAVRTVRKTLRDINVPPGSPGRKFDSHGDV